MDKSNNIDIIVCANGFLARVPNTGMTIGYAEIRAFNYKHELYAWLDKHLADPEEEPFRRE